MKSPDICIPKKGDLVGVHVYKYKVSNKQYLLGYRYDTDEVVLKLLALGLHENFYRDLMALESELLKA